MTPSEIFDAVAAALIDSAPAVLEREEIMPETTLPEIGFADVNDFYELCFVLEDSFPDADLSTADSWTLVSDVVAACSPV